MVSMGKATAESGLGLVSFLRSLCTDTSTTLVLLVATKDWAATVMAELMALASEAPAATALQPRHSHSTGLDVYV